MSRVIENKSLQFLHEMRPGDTWVVNPYGPGIIVCNPNFPPLWIRVENGQIEKDEIKPLSQENIFGTAQDQAAGIGEQDPEKV